MDLLLDRGTGNFSRRRIFYQVINRYIVVVRDLRFDVLYSYANVGAYIFFGAFIIIRCQQLIGSNRRVLFAYYFKLIFTGVENVVEYRYCRVRKVWVSDLCVIVIVIGFQRFIRFYFVEYLVIVFFIFVRNKRRYVVYRKSIAFMVGFN